MSAVGVGLIGSGVISDTYLENLGSFPDVDVVIIGDLNAERARAKAEKHGIPKWGTADDVLADPDVQVVVNLTIPAAHVEVSAAAIGAGKHVGRRSRSASKETASMHCCGVRMPRVSGSVPLPTRSSVPGSRRPSAPSRGV